MGFNDFESVQRLRELALNPIDLTDNGTLSPKRLEEMQAKALGLKLFYGTERVTPEVMESLFALAKEANVIEKMQAMQDGEVINKIEGYESEDRKVLHTAMRDFFEGRNAKTEEEATLAYQEFEKLKEFLDEIDRQGFTDLVQVGIGGSDLGPRAIYLSLQAYQKEGRQVHFLSNVDPDDARAVFQGLDLEKTLVVVVSKSGSTLETLTNETLARKYFEDEGLDPVNHFIAVTGKGSPMDNPSRYRASFYMWDYVGGRYSATSMVGCVSLAFAIGMDKTLDFLRGASNMDKVALNPDPMQNLPLLSALLGIWNRNFLGHHTVAVIPYSNAMIRFPAHLQQCDMESNGKRIDKQGNPVEFVTGPVIWGEPGTNGQHSFYQLIHQGTNEVPVEFIGFRDSQFGVDLDVKGTLSQEKLLSNLFAQSIGLATGKHSDNPNKVFPGNRPNRLVLAAKCEPYTVGSILSYFENKVAFQGFMWNINSFDQEGVQLGKVLANQIIDLFAKKRKGEELGSKDFPLGQAYLRQLDDL
ncbi:MAG: Glucose-6-phosphate isomerase [Chlamydiia bacterium]|nr:Glucose-6-phosphate isomerase [Chlamydiia bacterium]MCH9615581.1 Glucose-6-phosphate isomerase [Chlamydiia bacterium]MCH9629236.1 Glucose-6-phosphate isomerase [Chlamydiia bacterium]